MSCFNSIGFCFQISSVPCLANTLVVNLFMQLKFEGQILNNVHVQCAESGGLHGTGSRDCIPVNENLEKEMECFTFPDFP